MLKLIVFDCDGVLFDSKEANRAYYNDLLDAFGRRPMSAAELDYVHMSNVNDSVAHIFSKYPDQDISEVHRYRSSHDYTPYLDHMIMEPDLVDFLDFATKSGYHLAISTNRTTTMGPLLAAYGLSDYFDKVVTAFDVANPKPAPDALFDILEHFGCRPEETLYIGDSSVDQLHAEAAGVELVAFRNDGLKARYHVKSFTEIKALPPLRPSG
jgi:HAD superfamily hydrolase (TIGR01509 family)